MVDDGIEMPGSGARNPKWGGWNHQRRARKLDLAGFLCRCATDVLSKRIGQSHTNLEQNSYFLYFQLIEFQAQAISGFGAFGSSKLRQIALINATCTASIPTLAAMFTSIASSVSSCLATYARPDESCRRREARALQFQRHTFHSEYRLLTRRDQHVLITPGRFSTSFMSKFTHNYGLICIIAVK